MDVWQVAFQVVSPVLVFFGIAGGWFAGRRREQATVEHLTVQASQVAVETLLETVAPLKEEINRLKAEVVQLRRLNQQLVDENRELKEAVDKLRRSLSDPESPSA